MNFLRGLVALVQFFVVGFWPIWLGILLVFVVAFGLKVSTLQNLHRKQKIAMYTFIVLPIALFSFIWANSLLANVYMLFAHISFYDEVIYTDELAIPRKQIHREVLLRMVLPPLGNECFFSDEICDWADYVLEDAGDDNISSYTMAERWLGYILRFLVFGLPLGLGMAWLLNRLIKYRLSRQTALPS